MIHSIVFRVTETSEIFSRVFTQPFQALTSIVFEEYRTAQNSQWYIKIFNNNIKIDQWTINFYAGGLISIVTKRISYELPKLEFNRVIERLAEILNQDEDGYGYNIHFGNLFEEVKFKLENIHYLEYGNNFIPHCLRWNLSTLMNQEKYLNERRKLEEIIMKMKGTVTREFKNGKFETMIELKGSTIKF